VVEQSGMRIKAHGFPFDSHEVIKLSCSLVFSDVKAERLLGNSVHDTLKDGIRREVEMPKKSTCKILTFCVAWFD